MRAVVHGPSLQVFNSSDPWLDRFLEAEAERDAALMALGSARSEAQAAEKSARGFEQTATRLAHAAARLAAIAPIDVGPELASRLFDESIATTDYSRWLRATKRNTAFARVENDMAYARGDGAPYFSVIVPVFKVPLYVLRDMVESVRRQTYPFWQLCIAHACPEDIAARNYLRELVEIDDRVRLVEIENRGIAENSNSALELVDGDFVVLLDHDDIIVDHALASFAHYLREFPDTDFLYSDKDMTDEAGRERINPLFKPEWSPELMLTVNYVTHLNAMRTSKLRDIRGWRSETDGAQDWDVFLRFIESSAIVGNVREVLYSWRMIESSVAAGGIAAKPYALAAQVRTLEDSLLRRGVRARFELDEDGVTLRPRWNDAMPGGVTAIIMGADDDETWAAATAFAESAPVTITEILVPLFTDRNSGIDDLRLRAVAVRSTESRVLLAAALNAAKHEFSVVIDAGTQPQGKDWLLDLVGPLAIPGVGLVGPKVLEDDRDIIARAGIVFDTDGSEIPLFRNGDPCVYTIMGSAHWIRNVTAIDGGIFAVRTNVAREALVEKQLYGRADVDLSLSIWRAGLRVAYTPFCLAREHSAPVLSHHRFLQAESKGVITRLFAHGDPRSHPHVVPNGPGFAFRLPATLPEPPYDYRGEAEALTSFFDGSGPARSDSLTSKSNDRAFSSAMWIIPEFTHAHYGGIATILRFAEYLAKRGVRCTFVVTGFLSEGVLRKRVTDAFPGLHGATFIRVKNFEEMHSVPESDVGIATLWTTAYYLRHANTRQKWYFVQDAEAQFYPAGSTSALVEATYRFGFTAICNTISLAEIVRSYGGEAIHFTPAIDTNVFYHRNRPQRTQKRLFAYARPGHARNGFEFLKAALIRVKGQFGDGLDIITAGAAWSPSAYGLEHTLTNLGLLSYEETGDLYRSCDAGAVVMMTSHPSYLPMELMACGASVITNFNPRTAWLLRDGENAFLAETTPVGFADRIIEVLSDESARGKVSAQAALFVSVERSDWDGEWARLIEKLT